MSEICALLIVSTGRVCSPDLPSCKASLACLDTSKRLSDREGSSLWMGSMS